MITEVRMLRGWVQCSNNISNSYMYSVLLHELLILPCRLLAKFTVFSSILGSGGEEIDTAAPIELNLCIDWSPQNDISTCLFLWVRNISVMSLSSTINCSIPSQTYISKASVVLKTAGRNIYKSAERQLTLWVYLLNSLSQCNKPAFQPAQELSMRIFGISSSYTGYTSISCSAA